MKIEKTKIFNVISSLGKKSPQVIQRIEKPVQSSYQGVFFCEHAILLNGA